MKSLCDEIPLCGEKKDGFNFITEGDFIRANEDFIAAGDFI